ncbi:MAG: hypothetical protein AAGN46_06705 [Acidobacteriota bacterium]
MSDEPTPAAAPSFLSADGMKPHLNDRFRLRGALEGEDLDLDLVAVETVDLPSPRPDGPPFTLLFRGPMGAAIEQQIYTLEHATLGAFDLFLVCVGPDPDDGQMRYEAIFA